MCLADLLCDTDKVMLENIYKKIEKSYDYFTDEELDLMEFLGFFDSEEEY